MGNRTERSTNGKPSSNSKPKTGDKSGIFPKTRFINPHFNSVDREKLKTLILEQHFCVAEFLGELAQDYNLSIKFDENSGKWNALLIPCGAGHAHSGFILSVRHSDRLLAVLGLYYAHVHKLNGQWGTDETELEDEWA